MTEKQRDNILRKVVEKKLTAREAGAKLGLSTSRVYQLVAKPRVDSVELEVAVNERHTDDSELTAELVTWQIKFERLSVSHGKLEQRIGQLMLEIENMKGRDSFRNPTYYHK